MQIGMVFEDKYRILKKLGQGGMSKVYLAENIKVGTLWAIKEISKHSDMKVDFLVEPNILKKLDHPALPRIFDIIEDENCIYVVVDYIDGVSLDKKLEDDGKFNEAIVIEWAKQLCKALEYLHSLIPNPIIYRDMKPSNIILTENGTLKLIDFGIAREYKSHSDNDTVFIGTRGYAAPEQYGIGQTTFASDIYSLGVTLYQLLTGKSPNEPPYEIKPVRCYNKSLSKEIENIICKCTKQNPTERYQSVKVLQNEIQGMEFLKSNKASNPAKESTYLQRDSKTIPFKKLVLTVWDNAEFGCEFAYEAARLSGYSVLLIDLDLLAPKADLHLNLRKYTVGFENGGLFGSSGLNIVMDSIEKNFLTSEILLEASMKRSELKNLFILTGNYKIENYEYYRDDSLFKLIEKAYQSFDITLLLVNKSIYDSFTVVSLAKSDYNLVAIRADVDKLREFNSYIVFLKDKQHISMNKMKFVAFEYEEHVSMGMNELREITQDNLIGKVNYSRKRAVYRNLKASYVRRMEKEIINEYASILSFFNIVPAYGFFNRLIDWTRSVINTFEIIFKLRKAKKGI